MELHDPHILQIADCSLSDPLDFGCKLRVHLSVYLDHLEQILLHPGVAIYFGSKLMKETRVSKEGVDLGAGQLPVS